MTGVRAYDPYTGEEINPPVDATPPEAVNVAVEAAAMVAASTWASGLPQRRIDVLVSIAAHLDSATDELVTIAERETALGRSRLRGEVARTSGQLRMFAEVVRDGGYLDVIVSPAGETDPEVRRMLRPLGPVAVFSASNFPFAFSVAGGDTASALAAGCPVIVKAHEAHPQTSLATAHVVQEAIAAAGAPAGLFALVTGFEAGVSLLRHPAIRAAAFTGSLHGGRHLFDVAASRAEPIPFFGEMGSVNPAVVLPAAAAARGREIADSYAGSLTLGVGQFCTNPGLLFVPSAGMVDLVAGAVRSVAGGPMLTERIHHQFQLRVDEFLNARDVAPVARGVRAQSAGPWNAIPYLFHVDLATFADRMEELSGEVFGPAGLVITFDEIAELVAVLARLPGQLSASVHADPEDAAAASLVREALAGRVGRLTYNEWTTGVSVCWAMTHGGPWPATTAMTQTSVGATAINRWLAPISFQNWPDALLPKPLQQANPWRIPQCVRPRSEP